MRKFTTQTLSQFKGLDLTSEGIEVTEEDLYLTECINFSVSDRGSLIKRTGIKSVGRNLSTAKDSPVLIGKTKNSLPNRYDPILLYFENSLEMFGLLDTDLGVGWVKLHTGNFSAPVIFGRNQIVNFDDASYFPGSLSETGTSVGVWKYDPAWGGTTDPTNAGTLTTVNPSPRCSCLVHLTDRLWALDNYSIVGENRVYYSNAGSYGTWTVASDFISFRDTHLTNIIEYKQKLLIFSNNKIWILDTSQGGVSSWTKNPFSHNLGTYTFEGTVNYNGWLYFLDNTGLYRTDLSTVELLSQKLNRLFKNRVPQLHNSPTNFDCISAYNGRIYMSITDEFFNRHTFVYDIQRETWSEFSFRIKTDTMDIYKPATNFLPVLTGSRYSLGYFEKSAGGSRGEIEPGMYMCPYDTLDTPVERNKSVYLYSEDDKVVSDEVFKASFSTQRLSFKETTQIKRCPEIDMWYSTKDEYDVVYTIDDIEQETVNLEKVPGFSESTRDWGVQRVRGPKAPFRNLQLKVKTEESDRDAEFGSLVLKYKAYNAQGVSHPSLKKDSSVPPFGAIISDQTETWHVVGASGEPAFENSWTNEGSTWQVARFRKDNGVVHVQGLVHNGTVNTAVFTLPLGYRPEKHLLWGGEGGAALHSRLDVQSDGKVLARTNSNVHFTINCIFPVDDVIWNNVGTVGQPAFMNSWVNYDTGWAPARFAKKLDIVYLQGLVKNGTIGDLPSFLLPSDYRPPGTELMFHSDSNPEVDSRIDVNVVGAGGVELVIGANGYFSLTPAFYPVIDASLWHEIGDLGEPGFQNGWLNLSTEFGPARFVRVLDTVYIQGVVKNGTMPSTVFTLPSGFRPSADLLFGTHGTIGGHGRIDIPSSGNVIIRETTNNVTISVAFSVADI